VPSRVPGQAPVSRESRLLLLAIAVCAVVLLVLARLRFPETPATVDTTAPPLERLAARASYDALAADIQRVEALIARNLVVLRVAQPFDSIPRTTDDVLAGSAASGDVRHTAALRTDAGSAVAWLGPGTRIEGILGGGTGGGTAEVLAADPVRQIARIRVPEATSRALATVSLSSVQTPVYVVVVEGTQAGVTLRPVFLGRGDRFATARWSRPLLPLGGVAVSPGALLFSLAGEFVGMVVPEGGAPVIVGATDVLETAQTLASSPSRAPSTLGIAIQPLTPSLSMALGAHRGVVVSEVDPGGPAAGVLQPADVIAGVDDWSTDDPEDFLLRLAARPVGQAVALTVVRKREPLSLTAVVAARTRASAGRGISFVPEPGVGTRAVAGSAFAGLDLEPGDVVVRAGNTRNPTPVQLQRRLEGSGQGEWVVLTIRRDGRQRIVAVRPSGSTRGPER
jgi:hypothetical protein